jgi:VIT1/CCC1 family predicted Fe2+/Mn2+ transporter
MAMDRNKEQERASNSTLNWLRASVLGANDGIVSVSSIILGVAGATSARHTIFIAGLAGLVAGAFSMAVGEYVSVSSQRATELQIDENDLNNPTQAAIASMVSFTAGGLIPLLAVMLASQQTRIAVTFVAVLIALTITGYASATVGNASRKRAILRVVIGGAIAMALTYLVGRAFGTSVS